MVPAGAGRWQSLTGPLDTDARPPVPAAAMGCSGQWAVAPCRPTLVGGRRARHARASSALGPFRVDAARAGPELQSSSVTRSGSGRRVTYQLSVLGFWGCRLGWTFETQVDVEVSLDAATAEVLGRVSIFYYIWYKCPWYCYN